MIEIRYKFTGELTPEDIDNYGRVFETVFGGYDRARFEKKFLRDIYGDSLFLFAFEGEECVGTQVFWRNDVGGCRAYQSCDSAILPGQQGKGIFSSLVRKGVEVLGDVLIYGWPNCNSIHAFRKMGWIEKGTRKSRLYFRGRIGGVDAVDKDYAEWLFSAPTEHCFSKQGDFVLILKELKYHCFRILGKIPAADFDPAGKRRVKLPILFYHSEKGKIGTGNRLIVFKDLPAAKNICDYKLDVDLF